MIYFGFSDETGDYRPSPGQKFLRSHPFYLRATLLIRAEDWRRLATKETELREKHLTVFPGTEIKWAHLWSIRKHEQKGEKIPRGCPYAGLGLCSSAELTAYVEELLQELPQLPYARVILTFTTNDPANIRSVDTLYKWHLQEVMQRVQMEVEGQDNLAVLFFDPISEDKNKSLRDAYRSAWEEGDFVKYSHIKDSLNFELSHQSVGIQIADYLAGVSAGRIKGFSDSVRIFDRLVRPLLRKGAAGQVGGYGVREVPRSVPVRAQLLADLGIPR